MFKQIQKMQCKLVDSSEEEDDLNEGFQPVIDNFRNGDEKVIPKYSSTNNILEFEEEPNEFSLQKNE